MVVMTAARAQLLASRLLCCHFSHVDYLRRHTTVRRCGWQEAQRFFVLTQTDNLWKEHLQAIKFLQQAVGFRGYAQRDPLVEYKLEGYNLFLEMMAQARLTPHLTRVCALGLHTLSRLGQTAGDCCFPGSRLVSGQDPPWSGLLLAHVVATPCCSQEPAHRRLCNSQAAYVMRILLPRISHRTWYSADEEEYHLQCVRLHGALLRA